MFYCGRRMYLLLVDKVDVHGIIDSDFLRDSRVL